MQRFIGDYNLSKRFLRIHDKNLFDQVRKVLRLGVGGKFCLCDGKLNEAEVQITGFKPGVIEVELLKTSQNQNEPEVHTILYCSILKRANFELVVQKATEVGVSEIVPLICKRTIKLRIRPERLAKIMKEAAEQSGRGILPKLHEALKFEDAISQVNKNSKNYIFDASGELLANSNKNEAVGVWIGPEGGWEESEIASARKENFKIVSLGELTFRAETAAIIASYLCSL